LKAEKRRAYTPVEVIRLVIILLTALSSTYHSYIHVIPLAMHRLQIALPQGRY